MFSLRKAGLTPERAEWLRRHWPKSVRWRQQIRFSEGALHLVLAGGVGLIGGLSNLLFFYAIEWTERLMLHRVGRPEQVAEAMSPWQRVLTPALGGLLAGAVLYWGLRLAGPQRTTNILEVVVAGDGRLPFRNGVVKCLSSLITIGSGGSIGREGGITQLAATLSSKWGQLAGWHPYRLRLLVGCGAASGISAAYNAPISGAVFAAWIVLGDFSMNLFGPLVFASVIAAMVSRTFFGIEPWYHVPPFPFTSVAQLPWFLAVGVVTGLVSALFLRSLGWAEAGFKLLRAPLYVKVAAGGLLAGLVAVWFPAVWGNGYVLTNRILHGDYAGGGGEGAVAGDAMLLLAGIMLAKLLATLATVGSGAVGGVLTPTLFFGAAAGAMVGLVLQSLHLAAGLPVATFAVVGMGGMLSATTHSPLLAMILVMEISLDYSLMPPLMLASVVSMLVSRKLHPDSIYTEPLRRKGLKIAAGATTSRAAMERTVAEVMLAPVPPLRETSPLTEIARRFLASANNFLPVVDERGRLIGLVALQDLKEHLTSPEGPVGVIAYDVMRPPPACVTPRQRLLEVLPLVLESELRNIPVVNTFEEYRLVGALARAEVLAIFSEAIATRPQGGT